MFQNYYQSYLNVKKYSNQIVASNQRLIPLNKKYYYSVIVSDIEDKRIYSVQPQWYEIFKKEVRDFTNHPGDVLNDLNDQYQWGHQVRSLYRMKYKGDKVLNSKAQVLTASLFKQQHKDISDQAYHAYLERNKDILDQGRRFWIYDHENWAGAGLVSDVDFNGGNIAVYVDESYRKKGYGKELVKACISWCIQHHIQPVYLVDTYNKASIALAESLGFEIYAREWILSEEK